MSSREKRLQRKEGSSGSFLLLSLKCLFHRERKGLKETEGARGLSNTVLVTWEV